MNSNQRSEGNNQSNNGGNELDMNSARAGTADRDKLDPATQRAGQGSSQSGMQGSQQSGNPGSDRNAATQGGTYQETGAQPTGAHQPGYQNADQGSQQSGQNSGQRSGRNMAGQGVDRNLDPQGGSMQSTDRSGSQTGSRAGNQPRQGGTDDRQSNDAAGSYPMSPGGSRQSADEKMNDDTGLSNTANRQQPDLDPAVRQENQSNVGRRSDGTPD